MMLAIARSCVPDDVVVTGATATRGPPMITTPAALAAAADEVVEISVRGAGGMSGIIVGAFGDPGLETLRRSISIPAVGICEAAMIEAASGGTPFRRRYGNAGIGRAHHGAGARPRAPVSVHGYPADAGRSGGARGRSVTLAGAARGGGREVLRRRSCGGGHHRRWSARAGRYCSRAIVQAAHHRADSFSRSLASDGPGKPLEHAPGVPQARYWPILRYHGTRWNHY